MQVALANMHTTSTTASPLIDVCSVIANVFSQISVAYLAIGNTNRMLLYGRRKRKEDLQEKKTGEQYLPLSDYPEIQNEMMVCLGLDTRTVE